MTDRRLYWAISAAFRRKRNKALSAKIDNLYAQTASPVKVLDVGGLPAFWNTLTSYSKCVVTIINDERGEHSSASDVEPLSSAMTFQVGDACSMPEFLDKQFDLVVCNSVLEHVGDWSRVQDAASELQRVASHGWIQVPAFEFPLEVHYMLPFVHWFAEPVRGPILRASKMRFRKMSKSDLRNMMDYVRLMTRREFSEVLPKATVTSERFLGLRKSHIATW